MAAVAVVVLAGLPVGAYLYRSSVQNAPKPIPVNSALVREDSHSMGPADAKVTIVEFYDPECESCAAFGPVVKKIMQDYDGRARLVTRYMPLHPNSMRAAHLLEAAAEEGKYWQALELIFRKQDEWGEKHGAPPNAPKPDVAKLFEGYAKELGLDIEKYIAAARENRYAAKVERDRKDGQTMGVRRTPTFFVNGRELARFSEKDLRSLIEEEMAK